MTVQVKICGITDPMALAAAAGADWVGFVFFPPSPRALAPAQAAALSAGLAGGPARVGLFVDPTDAAVAEVLAALPLDALQVYASAERVAALRARFGRPVWRAIGIATAADLPTEAGAANRFVLEAKPPAAATRLTGTVPREHPQEPPPEDQWSQMHPANVSPFVAYLSTGSCPIHGRVFFVHGGNVHLFQPFAIVDQISKEGFWTVEELEKEAAKFSDYRFDLGHPLADMLWGQPAPPAS